MAYWKVAGFSQPSPIEQILDKEEFTLEELLDEDDIIQECKSLNGRLIAFLREKSTVELLLQYLIDPPNDPDDPKKQYRYPFTACEVFCCEVEAVFNTLLEEESLLGRLFSLLDQPPPLACKAAGYFGRVLGQLLLRKTNEMMQYLSHNEAILGKLMTHVDTTSIADIVKRLVGADDHSSMIFSPMHTQWLAETPLIAMLLERLGAEFPPPVQANAADILTAIAHTQPSALASQLMQQQSINALFSRALQPGSSVLVTALDVCTALLEPRRSLDPGPAPCINGSVADSNGGPGGDASISSPASPAAEATSSMLQYLPQLLECLRDPARGSTTSSSSASGSGGDADAGGDAGAASTAAQAAEGGGDDSSSSGSGSGSSGSRPDAAADISLRQETPYGLLAPPLGRARLRIVELLAALVRIGDDGVDAVLIKARALPLVQELFAAYPFNNLLHHQMYALLLAALRRASPVMLAHVFSDCRLVGWLNELPREVSPTPRPGSSSKAPLRAGYLGHVTRLGAVLQDASAQQQGIADALAAGGSWLEFQACLAPQLELEDVMRWQCGRPANMDGGDGDSDVDEAFNDMESLEQIQGMPPGMYHRYGVLDDDIEEDEEEGMDHSTTLDSSGAAADGAGDAGGAGGDDGGAQSGSRGSAAAYTEEDMLVAGMAGLGVNDPEEDAAAAPSSAGDAAVAAADGAADPAAAAAGAPGPAQPAMGGNWSLLSHPGASSSAVDIPGERLMDDDAVLLADDDMAGLTGSAMHSSPLGTGSLAAAAAASPPADDMVLVDDAEVVQQASPPVHLLQASGADAGSNSSSATAGDADTHGLPAAAVAVDAPAAAAPAPHEAVHDASGAADMAAEPLAAAMGDADAGATAVVEQASGSKISKAELALGSPGSKDSNGKRQTMSHPVEVPAEELS